MLARTIRTYGSSGMYMQFVCFFELAFLFFLLGEYPLFTQETPQA
jgi:hypothetical protein